MKLIALFIILFFANTLKAQVYYNEDPDWESDPLSHVATGLGLADINGDGHKDLVVGNGNDISIQSLVVYYNDGTGHFNTTPDWESEDIDYHGHLSCGDVDNDGDVDVAVSVYIGHEGFSEPGKVKVYYNTGNELESTPSFVSEPFYTFSCVLGDADGDGDLDLATTAGEPYSNLLDHGKIFYNEEGLFSDENLWESDIEMGSLDVAFGDLDANGFLDLFFACENTPNYVYLADNEGNIDSSPDWTSTDNDNFVNSVEIEQRISEEEIIPYAVMTENDQLGGEGRVKEYVFGTFPASTEPSWTSEPFGAGSGIVTGYSDSDDSQHQKTLFYGGWWLPVNARTQQSEGFSETIFTSNTSSVVEAIELSDLDKSDYEEFTWNFTNTKDYPVSILSLPHSNVENILSVTGQEMHDIDFSSVAGENWIALNESLLPGQSAEIVFNASYYPDMVITNWDGNKGNYIFYNTYNPTSINQETSSGNVQIYPNPFNDHLDITCSENYGWEGNIYDINGNLMHQLSSNDNQQLQTKGWEAGLYFIRVITVNGAFTKKLIKE